MDESEQDIQYEKDEVDYVFKDKNIDQIESLEIVLKTYLQKFDDKLIPTRKEANNNTLLLFSEKKNEILYRGYIIVNYFNHQKLKRCLYITHVIISPRGGGILNNTLKKVLQNDKIDSIYIESILSDKVLYFFKKNDWTIDRGNDAYLKKNDSNSSDEKIYNMKTHTIDGDNDAYLKKNDSNSTGGNSTGEKTHKTKTHKRKTNKRKTNKRKTNKRKTHKK